MSLRNAEKRSYTAELKHFLYIPLSISIHCHHLSPIGNPNFLPMNKPFLLLLLVISAAQSFAGDFVLLSPDRQLTARLEIGTSLTASLQKGNDILFILDKLSMEAKGEKNPFADLRVKKSSARQVDETVLPVVRDKSDSYRNHYNELIIDFKSGYSITLRLFNEGLAYRFSTSLRDSLTILRENLSIKLGDNDSLRFQASKSFKSSYETPYEFSNVGRIEAGKLLHLPVLVEKDRGPFVMVTEADLYNYPGMWLRGTGKQGLTVDHPAFPKSGSYGGNLYNHGQVAERYDYIARVGGTRSFPWRIFAVAGSEEGLISNNMVYLLASPTGIGDVSWIKPGVVMFDWWGKHNIYGVDFKAGVNTETAKYYIDFCAQKGIRYFLFDDGWSPKDDLLQEVPGLNMAEITAYAKSKGVDVMLWVVWHSLYKQWDQAFDLFEKWGIKGIKMDFMDRDDQQMVEFYEAVSRKAAEKKMVVNFHGAYKPCGLSRKYPNVLTREALIEFEYNGGNNLVTPQHHNLLPYIRMFTGPMDYIPGTLRNATRANFRPVGDYPMGQGTRAHSMALFVILSSPMEMLPDSPSDYYREKECTDFLTGIPVEWNETRLLNGRIGKYTILARRSGTDWYVGAITDWEGRNFELPTSFLAPGKYHLEMIEDGINASTRAEDYRKKEYDFTAGEILKIKMAPGGGWVGRMRKER